MPFGSQEDLLLSAGIKDVDYHLDDLGNPVLTDRVNPDANYVPWKYVVQHPQVMYVPDIPNYAQTLRQAEQVLIPAGVADPTLGYYSPSSSSMDSASIKHSLTRLPTSSLVGAPSLNSTRW